MEVLGPPTAKVRIVDKTNLTGDFDFTLHFTNNPKVPRTVIDPNEFMGPTIFEAVGGIGAKLEKEMALFDHLIVDHVEKVPTEN